MLIDFFGIWCPPCNELDEEVFSSPEFKSESSRFVKLKLDADKNISWNLKSKYNVAGYPTLVFASSDGEEISRVVGFRNKDEMIRLLNSAWNARNEPLSKAIAKAKKGDRKAQDRLGLASLEKEDFKEAIRFLEKSQAYREQYYEAKIGSLKKDLKPGQSQDALIQTLEKSLQEYPNTPGSVTRRIQLASLYEDQKNTEKQKQTLKNLVETAQKLAQNPKALVNTEMSAPDLWASIAEAQETLGNTDSAKAAWKEGVAEYRKRITTGKERGYHLELAYCLWKSGDFAGAEKIYTQFEQSYPDEFTFYYNHAHMKKAQKDFPQMEKLARQAFNYSYGDNRLRAAYLLGESIQLQGRKKEALQQIQAVLNSTSAPQEQNVRTHRYLQQLQKLEKDLET